MTLDELISDLDSRIGSTPELTTNQKIVHINAGLQAFCSEADFNWLIKTSTDSTDGTNLFTLPTDWKRTIELRIDSDDTIQTPGVYQYIPFQQRYGVGTTDKTYTIYGSSYRVSPTPESGSDNKSLTYIRIPTNMSNGSESPSDSSIANMPEPYHEALVLYAFAIYNSYDEEHEEKRELLGNPRNPVPGTYYYIVNQAIRDNARLKKGGKRHMLSQQEAYGYTKPNRVTNKSPILGV